jgi:CTP synthase (UTP-ammonia lyase)
MGIADTDSAEHGGASRNFIIAPVSCPVPDRQTGAPKLSGPLPLRVQPGCRLAAIYNGCEIFEEHFCNYEVNPAYHKALENAGLKLAAFDEKGELRAVELPSHPFFLATLYQPQLSSTESKPHPVIVAFLRAAAGL